MNKEPIKDNKEKKFNCKCKKPKPDNNFKVGEYEGRYQHCKTCKGKIWN